VTALAGGLSDLGVDVTLARGRGKDEVEFPPAVANAFLEDGKVMSNGVELTNWDLVHSHGLWLPFNHTVAGLAGKRHIISPRGMLEPWALNNSKWKKRVAWWLYQKRDLKRAIAFHATAESEAESIRRLGFKQPIAVIPNGVDLPEIFKPAVKPEGASKTALFLSRIHPKKGLPMLLDAWKRVAPDNWRLVIAGNDDGNHLPLIEKKLKELGLGDQVTIAGPLFGKAKDVAYRNADLFVLPSYSENFGIVVTEALGYQLPVLTTTGCPWQELITERCGWWVDPTPEGIEAGLGDALASSSMQLQEMGVRGCELVREKYQWPIIAENMWVFYNWILNGGEQPKFIR
jgi:glycosyltransferase involved in cell wall biosynthesis